MATYEKPDVLHRWMIAAIKQIRGLGSCEGRPISAASELVSG